MFSLNFIPVAVAFVVVAQATMIIQPNPCQPQCNDWNKNYTWALANCFCRVFQSPCHRIVANNNRLSKDKTPLVPVTEDLCINFIPEKCPIGFPVVALFPVPAPCGCNGKKGSIETKRFYSLKHLLKFSAENRKRKKFVKKVLFIL
ncbi:hypothetical protein KR074_001250 [Drosophila pseudoananassae]|nr:hypothetical protein KR074_001250 [Drosophila pseudoananassae]